MWLFVIIFLLHTGCNKIQCGDIFASTSEMEKLVSVQKKMLDFINNYITKQDAILQYLKKYHERSTIELVKALQDPKMYVANPINAVRILKQFSDDWPQIFQLINSNESLSEFNSSVSVLKQSVAYYPGEEDFKGAVDGLLMLQHSYQLESEDLAEGNVNGEYYSNPLEFDDCFRIGFELYNKKAYFDAKEWLKTSLRKHKSSSIENLQSVRRVDILEYLSYAEFNTYNIKEALRRAREVLDIEPSHEAMKEAVIKYEQILKHRNQESLRRALQDEFRKFCRGDVSEQITNNLKCRYATEGHPFMKIAPLKMEDLHENPHIVLYYDILSDEDIRQIMEISYPKLKRSVVVYDDQGQGPSRNRISKSAWISDKDNILAAKINQKISIMTGLVLDYSENLQVANYGIGGYFAGHYDYLEGEEVNNNLAGNRIATVLIYLTDVAEGGNTIFFSPNLGVKPKKGAAILWYNLQPSGKGIPETLHAACPVLRGNKWVLNKWIRTKGNEFTRPCGLKEDDKWSF